MHGSMNWHSHTSELCGNIHAGWESACNIYMFEDCMNILYVPSLTRMCVLCIHNYLPQFVHMHISGSIVSWYCVVLPVPPFPSSMLY